MFTNVHNLIFKAHETVNTNIFLFGLIVSKAEAVMPGVDMP